MDAPDPQSEMQRAARAASATGVLPRIGHVLFRYRSFTPILLLVAAVPLVWRGRGLPHSPLWGVSGIALCVAGQALRAWVLGIVSDGTSGQNEVLIATSLNTRGPYAHTRNPLYLGNFGITLGLALLAHDPLLLTLVLAAFALQYRAIVAVEEAFLRERFGPEFEAFCARVPRFFPRVRSASGGQPPAWSGARALRKEHNPIAAWLLLGLVLVALDRAVPLLKGGAAPTPSGLGIVPHTLGFALVLLAFLVVKAWKHAWLSGGFVSDMKRRFRSIAR